MFLLTAGLSWLRQNSMSEAISGSCIWFIEIIVIQMKFIASVHKTSCNKKKTQIKPRFEIKCTTLISFVHLVLFPMAGLNPLICETAQDEVFELGTCLRVTDCLYYRGESFGSCGAGLGSCCVCKSPIHSGDKMCKDRLIYI